MLDTLSVHSPLAGSKTRAITARAWFWCSPLTAAGCYLEQGEDFNRTTDVFSDFHEVARGTLLNITLERTQHMLSIIVPVLNEEPTIEDVLNSLLALDFEPLGLTKEIIVVDGGSTDRSVEIARGMRNVKIFELTSRLGRGAALRLGVEKARGNIVAFYPADAEYRAADLLSMVGSVVRSNVEAAFGTRNVKLIGLSAHMRQVYQNNRRLYLTSKYGGIALSVLRLLLYNRYVTEVLTSVKVFDAHLLKAMALEGRGIDLDTEIVAKLSRRCEYILELPVDFRARTRRQGKKITAGDGFKAMFAPLKHRFRAAR